VRHSGKFGQPLVGLNRGSITLLDMTTKTSETAAEIYFPANQETSDKATDIGQEKSFLIETELYEIV